MVRQHGTAFKVPMIVHTIGHHRDPRAMLSRDRRHGKHLGRDDPTCGGSGACAAEDAESDTSSSN